MVSRRPFVFIALCCYYRSSSPIKALHLCRSSNREGDDTLIFKGFPKNATGRLCSSVVTIEEKKREVIHQSAADSANRDRTYGGIYSYILTKYIDTVSQRITRTYGKSGSFRTLTKNSINMSALREPQRNLLSPLTGLTQAYKRTRFSSMLSNISFLTFPPSSLWLPHLLACCDAASGPRQRPGADQPSRL